MSRMKEERDTEVARPDKGSTVTAQGETQSPKPRMPHERDESALRAGRELERPVVAGLEAGASIGLVEAEHERARDAVAVHDPDQFLVTPDHSVDVRAEVGVGVEDLEIGREIGAQPLVPRRSDLPCSLERVHRVESSRPSPARVAR